MKKLLLILSFISIVSCNKETTTKQISPVLVKIEAVHTTGETITSNIIYVK